GGEFFPFQGNWHAARSCAGETKKKPHTPRSGYAAPREKPSRRDEQGDNVRVVAVPVAGSREYLDPIHQLGLLSPLPRLFGLGHVERSYQPCQSQGQGTLIQQGIFGALRQ